MSTADGRRGTKQRSKPADKSKAADRERKERDESQQHPSTSHSSAIASPSTSSIEELRAALAALPTQSSYLITDHQATVLASSGLLAQSSASAPLFHRLLLDVRGLLDHTPDRGREPVQSITVDYATYRYTVTLTPHFIIAVHLPQTAASHSTHPVDVGGGEQDDDEADGDEV